MIAQYNEEVTAFLDGLNHPFRKEIEVLRAIVLNTNDQLSENIKWNGPNYFIGETDLITLKIHPPKQLQLIFHRGAKVLEQPQEKLIDDTSELLSWKGNDRAIATFKTMVEIEDQRPEITQLVNKWVAVVLKLKA